MVPVLLATNPRSVTADVSDSVFGVTFAPTSISFTASTTSTTLRFAELTNSIPFNSYGPAIDRVTLSLAPQDITAAPEPTSLALLALGGLFFIRSRRVRNLG